MTFRGQIVNDPGTTRPAMVADSQSTPRRRRRVLVALAGLLALALGACSTSKADTTDAPAAADQGPTVTIKDLAYAPETLTVPAGATVTWAWRDGAVAHDVKGDGFQSKVTSQGTFAHRFDQPGSYPYLCTLHPNMTGVIEVTR
jgi:plastocyanin